MESDNSNIGNFSYGGPPARLDHIMSQHSGLCAQPQQLVTQLTQLPRMQQAVAPPEGSNPLDLTSAIVHELQRQPASWVAAWQPQLGGGSSTSPQEPGLQLPYGSFLSHQLPGGGAGSSRLLPQYNIPRFGDGLGASAHQQMMPQSLDYTPDTESLASAPQGFYSSRSAATGLPRDADPRLHTDALPFLPTQVLDTTPLVEPNMLSCSPWIERMMQADVTPTPCPSLGISTSLSLAQRTVGDVSCVASQTVDLQSCHSSGIQRSEKSMRSAAFHCDPQLESTVEISTDLCTDDDDLETRPIDEKRKKRMLSNRASAQRSRLRRQERLDQLEVLTAQLRVENSTLQKKLNTAVQVAKQFEDENKNLLKKVERLSKELEGYKPKKGTVAAFDECASNQQTTCASSSEMAGGHISLDPNSMRNGNVNDGASTPSISARSPGWSAGADPTQNEGEMDTVIHGSGTEVQRSSRRGKKRSLGQSEAAAAAAAFGGSHSASVGSHMGSGSGSGVVLPSRVPRPTSPNTSAFLEPVRPPFDSSHEVFTPSVDASNVDSLETDRWIEFAECFK